MQSQIKGEYIFLWEYRSLNVKDGIVSFSTRATCDPFDYAMNLRPIMLDKEEFVSSLLKFGIKQEDIDYFFSSKMEMTQENWGIY